MEEHSILLLNEDRTLSIQVWFLGFTLEAVQAFVKEHYADDAKNRRWTNFKILT